jgi:hypothetical protein
LCWIHSIELIYHVLFANIVMEMPHIRPHVMINIHYHEEGDMLDGFTLPRLFQELEDHTRTRIVSLILILVMILKLALSYHVLLYLNFDLILWFWRVFYDIYCYVGSFIILFDVWFLYFFFVSYYCVKWFNINPKLLLLYLILLNISKEG